MTRLHSILAAVAVLTATAAACNLPLFASTTPPAAATLGQLYTAAAQTLAAAEAQSSAATPSSTAAVPGAAPTAATATPTRTSSASALCEAAAFVKDVTIPDGTTIDPGTKFTKIWRLRNVGTCSWTTAYSLVFVSGDRMHAPLSVGLPGSVNPGQTIDLSVDMSSPTGNGNYQGYWQLRSTAGTLFGIGAQAQGAFWVKIRVSGTAYTAYDFARRYCDAAWENDQQDLPCPGWEGSDTGYVLEIEDAVLEDGSSQDDAGLLTVPRHAYNGAITGQYPPIKIREGDRFKARVNCAHNAFACNVIFSLYYQVGSGSLKTLGRWNEAYEGKWYTIDLDLSALAGSNVKFFLSVTANGAFNQDRALWIAPRISRSGSPPSTETPVPTPTLTPDVAGTKWFPPGTP